MKRKIKWITVILIFIAIALCIVIPKINEKIAIAKNEELLVESIDRAIECYDNYTTLGDVKYIDCLIEELYHYDSGYNKASQLKGEDEGAMNSVFITSTIGELEAYKGNINDIKNMEYLLEAFRVIKENVYGNEGYLYLQRFVNANH